MRILVEPTQQFFSVTIQPGESVSARLWKGMTEDTHVPVYLLVVSVACDDPKENERLASELVELPVHPLDCQRHV